jgi:hypothetical protein
VSTFRLTISLFLRAGLNAPPINVSPPMFNRSGNSSRSQIEGTQKLKMVFKAGMAKSIKKGSLPKPLFQKENFLGLRMFSSGKPAEIYSAGNDLALFVFAVPPYPIIASRFLLIKQSSNPLPQDIID